jgi:hypothetical protein
VEKAIKKMRNKKATGDDDVPGDVLKLLGEGGLKIPFMKLGRICLLQQVIEGKVKGGTEVTGRRGRRRRNLLDDLKGRRGYSHLMEEAIDCTVWKARFGRGFGPVVRQNTK